MAEEKQTTETKQEPQTQVPKAESELPIKKNPEFKDWTPEPQAPPEQDTPQRDFASERGAPKDIDPEPSTKLVHLPGVIADNFGTSPSQARMEIAMGRIEIDGEQWNGDKLDIPVDAIRDKEIIVFGSMRQFKFTYSG